jgi:hypothetical protein
MFAISARYLPAPPPGTESPLLWGDEGHVRSLWEPLGFRCQFRRRTNLFSYADPASYQEHMEQHFGPSVTARSLLDGAAWERLSADQRALFERSNTAIDGSLRYEGEYLESILVKQ